MHMYLTTLFSLQSNTFTFVNVFLILQSLIQQTANTESTVTSEVDDTQSNIISDVVSLVDLPVPVVIEAQLLLFLYHIQNNQYGY